MDTVRSIFLFYSFILTALLPTFLILSFPCNLNEQKNFPDYDALNTVERHKAYFDCAHKVGKRFAKPGQKIIYFLISDSHHLVRLLSFLHLPLMTFVN
jgi:hypothetical protein